VADLAAALRAQAAVLVALADELEQQRSAVPTSAHYSRKSLPPGASSWRAARERAAAAGVEMIKAGRDVLIVRSSWDAMLEAKRVRRAAAPVPKPSDADALGALGVRVAPSRVVR